MDQLVNFGGVVYGLLLVLVAFVRSPITEAFRVDALIFGEVSEARRPLNLLLGIAVAGYGAWSLMSS